MGDPVSMAAVQAAMAVGKAGLSAAGKGAAGSSQAMNTLSKGMQEASRLRMQAERTQGDAAMSSAQQRARALGYGQMADTLLIDAEQARLEAGSFALSGNMARIEADRIKTAADAARVRALQTDEAMREQMTTTLANVDAIRASGNVTAFSPTHMALINKVRETLGQQRDTAIDSLRIGAGDLDIKAIGERVRAFGLDARGLQSQGKAAALEAQSATQRANGYIADAAADYVRTAGEKQAAIELLEVQAVQQGTLNTYKAQKRAASMSMFADMLGAIPSVLSLGQSMGSIGTTPDTTSNSAGFSMGPMSMFART
jgi:hypothetical protein